jgi:hypothetical protein
VEGVWGFHAKVPATVLCVDTAFKTLRIQGNFQIPEAWRDGRSLLKKSGKKAREISQKTYAF